MRDIDVRNALRRKILAHHYRDSETLVVDELGLHHGAARVDLAVVNGRLHGFEIKSASDTLERLPRQIEHYRTVFDRVTVVAAEKHVTEILSIIPHWWGVKQVFSGERGAIHFLDVRAPRDSGEVDPVAVARLLWREEVVSILQSHAGVHRGLQSKSRAALYEKMAELLPIKTIRQVVREKLRARDEWRSGATQRQCDGSLRPAST